MLPRRSVARRATLKLQLQLLLGRQLQPLVARLRRLGPLGPRLLSRLDQRGHRQVLLVVKAHGGVDDTGAGAAGLARSRAARRRQRQRNLLWVVSALMMPTLKPALALPSLTPSLRPRRLPTVVVQLHSSRVWLRLALSRRPVQRRRAMRLARWVLPNRLRARSFLLPIHDVAPAAADALQQLAELRLCHGLQSALTPHSSPRHSSSRELIPHLTLPPLLTPRRHTPPMVRLRQWILIIVARQVFPFSRDCKQRNIILYNCRSL